MGPLTVALGIVLEILKGFNLALEKLAPEQVQAAWDRHEKRLEFWEGVIKWIKEKAND
jgi:hypothetical protein